MNIYIDEVIVLTVNTSHFTCMIILHLLVIPWPYINLCQTLILCTIFYD